MTTMAKLKKRHTAKTVKDFIKKAEAIGLSDDYLFLSTIERYEVQVQILETLRKTIEEEDTLVTKEYVKGRENLYTHPAITEYNKTTDSANKTVQTLDNLMKSQTSMIRKKDTPDPLMSILGDKNG